MSTHLSGSVLSTFLTVLAVGEDDPSAAYLRKKYLYVSNLVFWSEKKLPVTWEMKFIPALDKAMVSDAVGANSRNNQISLKTLVRT